MKNNIRPTNLKGERDLAKEWDQIASLRMDQIENGRDLSFNHVILPWVLGMAEQCDLGFVLDVGCGTGHLASKLAEFAESVGAFDISSKSITIAKEKYGRLANVSFTVSSIASYAAADFPGSATLAVANMSLMTVSQLGNSLGHLNRLLNPDGHLIFTITHPCFWPLYRGYASEEWFDYLREIAIEGPFSISHEISGFFTTHVHRPLHQYIAAISESGFVIENFSELMPEPEIEGRFPSPWRYPRFLGMKCKKVRD